jgi:hypothetical protein
MFVTACLSTLLLGCPSLPEVAWEGEHVIFAADHPEQLCGGTRAYLDERTGRILEDLGSGTTKIEYFWLDDISPYCSSDEAAGCVSDGVVFSDSVPHLHEIIHARSGDGMPPVLEEGFAFHFGDPYPVHSLMATRERLAELLTNDLAGIDGLGEYSRVAHFLSFISETYGRESLLELDAALSRKSSSEDVDAAFEALFGLGRDALFEAYAAYPECAANVDVSLACEGVAVARLEPAQPEFERRIDCAAVDAMGPFYGMAFTEDIIEIAPAIDGGRFVFATGDGIARGGHVVIRNCGPCSEHGAASGIGDSVALVPEAQLPAGRYLVQFHVPVDAGPVDFGIHISG